MPATIQRRRALLALATVLATFLALVVPLISHAIAQGAPKIRFINPSNYSDDGVAQTGLFVSNLETGTDESDDENETTYRINAWSGNTPADALVEFELGVGAANITLGTADRVADDTWEYNWDINVADGQYTLRAILYEGSGIFAEEVARHEQPIIVKTVEDTAAIDIVYPPNGGQAGVHTNPITGATTFLIDVEWSEEDITGIQLFYTLSDPGDEPVWKICSDFPTMNTQRFSCPMESQDQGGKSVTGFAAVANDDESGNGSREFNGAGDAVRIFPYEQDPSAIDIDRDTTRANSTNGNWDGVCSTAQTVTVLDQLGRPISGQNIDVHASGPSDQLKFNAGGVPLLGGGPPSSNRPPDKGHTGTELGYLCGSQSARTEFTGRQGDHNRVGVPDVKHVENTGGSGVFGARMHADIEGVTFLTFWADEDDDDEYCSQELAVAASIGWDSPAPAPVLEAPAKDICPIPTPPPPGGTPTGTGSPSPSPSGSVPPDPRGCTVTGTAGDDELKGTEGEDVICGLGGDDQITALSGNDTVYGDDGNDQIDAGSGDDTLDGGNGNDALFGIGGKDAIRGGSESDLMIGGSGDDTIAGNGKDDSLVGGAGRDILTGGSAGDVLTGGKGDDVLKAGKGKDDVEGGNGADTMKGGPANDRMDGQGGPDTMNGGSGKDSCVGGPGRDRQTSC